MLVQVGLPVSQVSLLRTLCLLQPGPSQDCRTLPLREGGDLALPWTQLGTDISNILGISRISGASDISGISGISGMSGVYDISGVSGISGVCPSLDPARTSLFLSPLASPGETVYAISRPWMEDEPLHCNTNKKIFNPNFFFVNSAL